MSSYIDYSKIGGYPGPKQPGSNDDWAIQVWKDVLAPGATRGQYAPGTPGTVLDRDAYTGDQFGRNDYVLSTIGGPNYISGEGVDPEIYGVEASLASRGGGGGGTASRSVQGSLFNSPQVLAAVQAAQRLGGGLGSYYSAPQANPILMPTPPAMQGADPTLLARRTTTRKRLLNQALQAV